MDALAWVALIVSAFCAVSNLLAAHAGPARRPLYLLFALLAGIFTIVYVMLLTGLIADTRPWLRPVSIALLGLQGAAAIVDWKL